MPPNKRRLRALSVLDLDEDAAVIARSPLIRGIERSGLHALVEASRREHVVELIRGGFRLLTCCTERWHVSRVGWEPRRRRFSPTTTFWRLWTKKLQPQRIHPCEDGPVSICQHQTVVVGSSIERVEVTSSENSVRGGICAADEGREIGDDPMRRAVGVTYPTCCASMDAAKANARTWTPPRMARREQT